MRAISLWEPWASAMAVGLKKNETRSWSTGYRGDLLICAAKRVIDPSMLDLPEEVLKLQLHHGHAVAVVELFQCVSTFLISKLSEGPEGLEFQLGDYSQGRFVWMTRNLRPLKTPLHWRGKQGMWCLTMHEEQIVRELLG